MGYTGEWYIVCGNNDESIPEYKKKWGEHRILIFDWYKIAPECNYLDNFGLEKMSSGAIPVRNATRLIALERGEKRHWQFDDDYSGFYHISKNPKKWHRLKGDEFERELGKLAEFADKASLANIGFAVASDTRPQIVKRLGHRVFNAHNLPTDASLFTEWTSRMNDDLINAIETYRQGKWEMFVYYMSLTMKPTQSEKGGNTDIYQIHGTVRKAAYAIMIDPCNVKLDIRHGRYHHRVNWNGIVPKVLHPKFGVKEI
jgi:hypothetical protein